MWGLADLWISGLQPVEEYLPVDGVVSEEGNLTKATVFIPKGSEKYFLDKVKEYAEKETKKGKPRNAPLINSIEDIKLALLESFWRPSEIRLIPQEIKTWCEVWVRIPEIITDNSSNFEIVNRQLDSFRELLNRNEIECKSNSILFPERAILLIRVNRVDLIELINQSDEIAEFRVAQEVATIWTGESNVDQTDWAEDLKTRLSIEESNIKVCLLDSGVNNGHLLLRDILNDSDCLTVDPSWGTDDRSEIAPKGHGTLMAGLGGYGVPDIQRALNSYENGFTFIAQESIQPFVKYKSEYKTNDMHLYDLPWPTELLMSLANTPVKLKITLSYFVEPSPGEIGWNNKYRYQSHGLRFDIKRTGESPVEFQKRINRTARDSGEEFENTSDPFKWQIGPNSRNVGSIHSDTIETTAAEITDCNLIAVYPVTGWWKTRTHLKKINQRTRYSLLVSLETPNEEIPLYSTVKNMIGVPVEIKV